MNAAKLRLVPALCLWLLLAGATGPNAAFGQRPAAPAQVPMYKPSERAPAALDITRNDYGYSATAPDALGIGDVAPDFVVDGATGPLSLAQLRQQGPVALIFYRGHW